MLVAQLGTTLCEPMDHSQALLSMEFSSQEYWSELPFPSRVDLPNSGIKSQSQLGRPGISQSQVSWFAGRFFTIWANLVVQFSSVTQSCPTLCDTMDYTTPGFPVHHQLLEIAQTHVHRVCDAIQPSHPLLSPSPPTFSLSQHQGLFQWFSSLH